MIIDEKIVNQNVSIEMAMSIIENLNNSFPYKDISFYKNNNGEIRFKLEL